VRARICETEWWPVLYLDTHRLDEPAPGYTEGPPVYDIPDDLVRRFKRARRKFLKVQNELQAWWDEQQQDKPDTSGLTADDHSPESAAEGL